MYKNDKEKIQTLLLIVLILLIPLIFISFEAIQKIKIVSELNTEDILTGSLDQVYENINSLPKNTAPSTIRKCLTEIFDLMNESKFDELYTLLTDDLKEYMFPTIGDFSNYMTEYLAGNMYSPNFSTYTKLNKEKNDIFIVPVNFLPYNTSKYNIETSTAPSKLDTFTLYLEDDSHYKFSFLSYIGKGEASEYLESDVFSCKIKSTHLFTSQTIYNIEITNHTDHNIFIDKDEIYVFTGLMPKFYSEYTRIPPKQTTNISYTIYTGSNLRESLPKDIYFRGIHSNGDVYLFSLPINYPVSASNF